MKIKTSTAGNKGFTLLELIIVLFIVGIASAVAFTSIGRLHEKTVFNEEARRIYLTAKKAREAALLGGSDTTLRIDGDSGKYWTEYGDGRPGRGHTLHKGFVMTGQDILFFPKGNSSGGVIKLNNGKGLEYTIEVDPVLGTASIKRF